MSQRSLPAVGFDRFVRREWLDRVLELALAEEPPEAVKVWIKGAVAGRDAARKTADVLIRWWFREYPETVDLRRRALGLALEMSPENWLVLHWGMALANFPLFHSVAQVTGRLLRLQGEFKSRDITQRILEMHANVGTIPRVVTRILQSMVDWRVIKRAEDIFTADCVHSVQDVEVLEWFVEVLVRSAGRDAWDLRDLPHAPEAFPFEIPPHIARVARQSEHLSVQYEGSDREIVVVRRFG